MNKPKWMSDEEWGKFIFEDAMGPLSGPPPQWVAWVTAALVLLALGAALWH